MQKFVARVVGTVVGLVFALMSASLCAEENAIPVHPALNDSFYFGAGAYAPTTSTTARLDSNMLGAGFSVDFEKGLGLQSDKTVPGYLLRWRFTERWRVEAEYFELKRSGNKDLEVDVQWGDQVFTAGTQVSSKFDFSDMRTSVGYSFYKTVDKELGLALGMHVTHYSASITASGQGTEGGAVTAPLPVVSAYGQFALTDEWAISSRLDRFSLSYDDYAGSITSMAMDVLYQPFRHVGFGFGYRGMFIEVTATADKWTGEINQSFQGPLVFTNISF